MPHRTFPTSAILLTGVLSACGQQPSAPAESLVPPARAHHSLAFDESRQRVVLAAGSTPVQGGNAFVFFNDTWEFDGERWTMLSSAGPRLSGASLAFDTRENRLLSFGGYDGASMLSSLRVLRGNGWEVIGQHPQLRTSEPGFVYDVARSRFIAYGGSAAQGQALGDTWEYDGSSWTKIEVANPPARQGHAMVYDGRRNRTVVFGGMGAGSPGQAPQQFEDTWEFDGQSWTQRQVSGPPARSSPGVAYDASRGLVILFGGAGSAGFLGDTWSWDGTQWRKLADNGPEPRAMGYLTYDKRRDRIVLFGGRKGSPNGDLNDTWEWDGSTWHRR